MTHTMASPASVITSLYRLLQDTQLSPGETPMTQEGTPPPLQGDRRRCPGALTDLEPQVPVHLAMHFYPFK